MNRYIYLNDINNYIKDNIFDRYVVKQIVFYENTFTTAGYPHMSMEPRSALAYWEDGKLYLHGGSQSLTAFADGIAGIIGVAKEDLVFVNAATGGGLGQRARAGSVPIYGVPAKLSQKINRPVMMRITREEEFTIGGARQGFQGWIKLGFKEDGTMSAADIWIVSDNGGKGGGGDAFSATNAVSIVYQAEAVRLRGVSIGSNTAHRGAQRGPGENQIAAIVSPILDKAADELGIGRLEIRKINTPQNGDVGGIQRQPFTSAYMPEALEQTAQLFDWEGRQSRRRQRNGSKVTGLGIGQGYHNAGRSGMDGIVMMGADGRLKIHNGVGNLGTYSYASTSRAAAEALKMPWESCDIVTGRTDLHLPITSPQDGSNSIFTNTRTCWGAAQDMLAKMKEIAANDLGGSPDDYDVSNERVHQIADESVGYSFAEVAQRAMELGGKYTGEAELPEDLAEWTQIAVSRLAGSGFMGVYHDPAHSGNPPGFTVTALEIELDTETGKIEIKVAPVVVSFQREKLDGGSAQIDVGYDIEVVRFGAVTPSRTSSSESSAFPFQFTRPKSCTPLSRLAHSSRPGMAGPGSAGANPSSNGGRTTRE